MDFSSLRTSFLEQIQEIESKANINQVFKTFLTRYFSQQNLVVQMTVTSTRIRFWKLLSDLQEVSTEEVLDIFDQLIPSLLERVDQESSKDESDDESDDGSYSVSRSDDEGSDSASENEVPAPLPAPLPPPLATWPRILHNKQYGLLNKFEKPAVPNMFLAIKMIRDQNEGNKKWVQYVDWVLEQIPELGPFPYRPGKEPQNHHDDDDQIPEGF